MSPEEQKALARRAIAMWASHNSDRAEEIFSEDYVNHQELDVRGGVSTRSLEAWKELVRGHHHAFARSETSVLMQIAENDLVATRWRFTVTHTGEFMGLAPTNKEITWTGVQIDRFDHGKIVESWVDWDKYRFFQGLAPELAGSRRHGARYGCAPADSLGRGPRHGVDQAPSTDLRPAEIAERAGDGRLGFMAQPGE